MNSQMTLLRKPEIGRSGLIRVLCCLILGFWFSQFALAADPIREAIKSRAERPENAQSKLNLELKAGEDPPAPLAPQVYDGFQGKAWEPFIPDPRERAKMDREEAKQRHLYQMALEKKNRLNRQAAQDSEKERGKGRSKGNIKSKPKKSGRIQNDRGRVKSSPTVKIKKQTGNKRTPSTKAKKKVKK